MFLFPIPIEIEWYVSSPSQPPLTCKRMLVNQGGKIAFEWKFIYGLACLFFYFLFFGKSTG